MNRRKFLSCATLGGCGLWTAMSARAQQRRPQRVSGAGVVLLGPFQGVHLMADFGFDETFLFWKVSTNFEDKFVLPTAQLGNLAIGPHGIFIGLQSTEIRSVDAQRLADGIQAILSGQLLSITAIEIDGRRQRFEDMATFTARAIDRGSPGVEKGDSLLLTVRYPKDSHHAKLFGELADFKHFRDGRLALGNVVVQI